MMAKFVFYPSVNNIIIALHMDILKILIWKFQWSIDHIFLTLYLQTLHFQGLLQPLFIGNVMKFATIYAGL